MLVLKQNRDFVTKVGVVDVWWPTYSQSPPHSVFVRNHPKFSGLRQQRSISSDDSGLAGLSRVALLGLPGVPHEAVGHLAALRGPGDVGGSQSQVWGLGAACVWASVHTAAHRSLMGRECSSAFLTRLWGLPRRCRWKLQGLRGLDSGALTVSLPSHFTGRRESPGTPRVSGRGDSAQSSAGGACEICVALTCHLPPPLLR